MLVVKISKTFFFRGSRLVREPAQEQLGALWTRCAVVG